ncbi:MAG TPA: LuxR C-terminal-related transcriptional regulator [Flavobacteriaceae bacterium]|nr:LuxR C-terminal-related transcriptional regulator [Flavobacteriaceae bacterium]
MKKANKQLKDLVAGLQSSENEAVNKPVFKVKTKEKPIPKKVLKNLPLSKRELEVVLMLRQGLRNKDIARKLHLVDKSVSTYIRRIYKKINLSPDLNIYALITTLEKKGIFEDL